MSDHLTHLLVDLSSLSRLVNLNRVIELLVGYVILPRHLLPCRFWLFLDDDGVADGPPSAVRHSDPAPYCARPAAASGHGRRHRGGERGGGGNGLAPRRCELGPRGLRPGTLLLSSGDSPHWNQTNGGRRCRNFLHNLNQLLFRRGRDTRGRNDKIQRRELKGINSIKSQSTFHPTGFSIALLKPYYIKEISG